MQIIQVKNIYSFKLKIISLFLYRNIHRILNKVITKLMMNISY